MAWFQTIPDSDQSISDEEEPEPNRDAISVTTQKNELLQLSSRIEILKGANAGANRMTKACNSEDEVSSDDEANNVAARGSVNGGAKELQGESVHSFWSAVREDEALMRLNERTYSNVKASSKGCKGKGKPKFSFRFPTHKKGTSSHSICTNDSDMPFKVQELPERLDVIELINDDHPETEPIEDIEDEEELQIVLRKEDVSNFEFLEDISGDEEGVLDIAPLEAEPIEHGCMGQSMAELLDGLQDKTAILSEHSRKNARKQQKRQQPVKFVTLLGDGTFDSESSPEHSGSELSTDTKLANPEMKRQTLVDRFQEVIGDRVIVAVPKTLKGGLVGQLQQVVQNERYSDMQFLKKIQEGATESNNANCLDVKIISKYLDAKLTVCHCSFANNLENLPEIHEEMVDEGPETIIIFNPRVCDDIDLDIGKWIRIHPPWKEICVAIDQIIILSSYFSEISM